MDDRNKAQAPKNTSSTPNGSKSNQSQMGMGTIIGLAGCGLFASKLILGFFSSGYQANSQPLPLPPENPSIAVPYSQPYPLEAEARLREQEMAAQMLMQKQRMMAEHARATAEIFKSDDYIPYNSSAPILQPAQPAHQPVPYTCKIRDDGYEARVNCF